MGGAIAQFEGADQALEAYEANDIAPWALFQGKEILCNFKGDSLQEGSAKLAGFLDMLTKGGSAATYQLRIYEDNPKSINNNTPYNFSFRFKLLEPAEYDENYMGSRKIAGRLEAIEKRLQEKEEDEDEEKPGGIQGMIAGLINRPEVQEALMQKVIGFIGTLMGGRIGPAAVGAVPQAGQLPTVVESYNKQSLEERGKFDEACRILLALDPSVGTNLLKIAQILQENPKKYNTFATML